MKIRSVTYFLNPGWPFREAELRKAEEFNAAARPVFEKVGFEVQSMRLVSVPFPRLIKEFTSGEAVEFAQALEQAARQAGYGYAAAGPACLDSRKAIQHFLRCWLHQDVFSLV